MDKQIELILGQLQTLIKNGQIIQAIKLIRTVKNVSLKDAKNFVDEFKRQIHQAGGDRDIVHDQGNEPPSYLHEEGSQLKYETNFGHSHQHKVEKDLPTEVYLLLQQGEKIEAIKALRTIRGLSLNEANNLVRQFYLQNPQYQFDDVKTKKSIIPIFIFVGFGIFFLRKILS